MNVAIISTNKNKYSETFIHNHVSYLPFKIHYLFDGYLPKKYSTDKGITEHSLIRRSGIICKLIYRRITTENNIVLSIEKYFRENDIQVALCEYGPSGVELMHLCRSLNIPFITNFFGYDAYRSDILETYGQRYKELFKLAARIIVVSEDMYKQLLNLGCPQNKLQLIPCGVNTDFFKPALDVKKKYEFVFCGRFVEKKSPLQIISSFRHVVNKMPFVKLVMIGDGELWGAGKQLSRELGLSDNIVFTGALPPDKVLEIYHNSRIFINHSVRTANNDSEGTPVSILEAMASGLVIVASRHAGIKDVIKNGYNGFLVNEGNLEELQNVLIETLHTYDSLTSLISNAVETVKRDYNLVDNLLKLTELINSVSNKGKII